MSAPLNPATMAHSLAAVREQLQAAAGQAVEAPQHVRGAYARALHAVDRALDAARSGDERRIGPTVADALRTIKAAQDEEREARLVAAARPPATSAASSRARPVRTP